MASREWMWDCLSTPSTSPLAYCTAANPPSDITSDILVSGLKAINNLYVGVCDQGSICGQYNGPCCSTFVGVANQDNALAVASGYCGGQHVSCFVSVANVLSCLQTKNNKC